MRPKRPTPPPEPTPTPPIPGVVTPESLDAINTPEINKLPAYVSPGKFQWTPPLPGPKGDKGDPGEPGVITRPITPPVATDEIADDAVTADKLAVDSVTQTKIAPNSVGWSEIREQSLEPEQIKTLSGLPATEGQIPVADLSQGNQWWFRWADAATRPLTPPVATAEIGDGQVTPDKLSFTPVARPLTPPVTTDEIGDEQVTQAKLAPGVGGDRFVFGTLDTGFSSADVMYLTDITADIPYTAFDLSPWVPANAKGVLLQIGIFNQAYSTGRAFFRVRTNEEQRDALGLGMMVGANSQVSNAGIVPLVVGTGPRTIEYTLESVGGPWIATFTLYITVVGYIM